VGYSSQSVSLEAVDLRFLYGVTAALVNDDFFEAPQKRDAILY
jgi:hypothetical protein